MSASGPDEEPGVIAGDETSSAETASPTVDRRALPLDEDVLDEIAARIVELPEPVAMVATGVEVARADGDATGVRKRLFELGIAVVRYGVSVALALLAERLGDSQAPRPVAQALARAARLSDGAWCALGRTVASHLGETGGKPPPAFELLRGKALAQLVSSRNEFVHGGGTGDDAPELILAVLDEAEQLLGWPLRVVTSVDPPSFQQRVGVPLRAGVWRKVRKPVFDGAAEGVACVVHDLDGVEHWTTVTPWLPRADKKLLLADSPHTSGARWRWFDSETGEHRDSPELDEAIRLLAGQDTAAPVPPCDRPNLVGRQQAMSVMRRAAELSRDGGVGVVVLTGPQGVGRGRLLETVREAAASFGFGLVLEASCLERRRGVLRPLRRATSSVDGLEEVRVALERAAAGDAVAGAAGLEAAVEAVEEALVEASLDEPLLLLVDDAQWADESTLTLLALLTERATRKAQGRVLVVTAIRQEPNPPAALTAFIGQVERDVGPGATRLDVGPLDAEQARKLVRGVAPLAKELERVLLAGAAGIPFFLVQSVLAWDETGGLTWRDGAWHPAGDGVLNGPVPGMADVVQARIVSYFEAGTTAERVARQLLCALGLAGGPLPQDQLIATLAAFDLDLPSVEHALEALVEAGLLVVERQPPEYRFAQPMVRQAVLDSHQGKPWLTRLHRALLDVLGRSPDADEDAAFIADGYAALGFREQALTWLGRAVEHAFTMGLFRQAGEHAETQAALATAPAERVAAELSAAEALLRAGDAKVARARYERVSLPSARDSGIDVRAQILAVRIAHALGEAVEVDDTVLVASADATGDVRLGIEARLALATVFRATRGLSLAAEAVRLLSQQEHGDLHYRAQVLRSELLAEVRPLDDPECRQAVAEARDAAERVGSAWALLDAENDWAIVASAAGQHDRAAEMLQQVARQAQDLHFGTLRRRALVNLATCYLRAGRSKEAAKAGLAAAEAARHAGDPSLRAMSLSVRADALRRDGLLDDAREAIDESVEIKLRAADPNVAIALLRQADIANDLGDVEGARRAAELAMERSGAADNDDQLARARLWLALQRVSLAKPSARAEMEQLLDELDDGAARLRPPTRALLECARKRIEDDGVV